MVAGLEVTATLVPHYSMKSYAFRVTDGERSLAYSGDSAPAGELADVARDADLFLCEATLSEASDDGDLRGHLTDGSALRKFAELVAAQSGDPAAVSDPARLPTAPIQEPVRAKQGGRVARIDALAIAMAGKALGAGRDHKDAPIDLAVGLVLQKKVGDAVEAGEPLAIIHGRTAAGVEKVAGRVTAAFGIAAAAGARPLLLRRVTASGSERLDT